MARHKRPAISPWPYSCRTDGDPERSIEVPVARICTQAANQGLLQTVSATRRNRAAIGVALSQSFQRDEPKSWFLWRQRSCRRRANLAGREADTSNVHTQTQTTPLGPRDLPARTIPVPNTVSPQMRMLIAAPLPPTWNVIPKNCGGMESAGQCRCRCHSADAAGTRRNAGRQGGAGLECSVGVPLRLALQGMLIRP